MQSSKLIQERFLQYWETNVSVNYKNQTSDQSLLVVAGDGPSLLGCDWLSQIKLDWKQLNQLNYV